MKKFQIRGRRLALWLVMFAVTLYTGCGVVTMEDKAQREALEQAIEHAASAAAGQAKGEDESVLVSELEPVELLDEGGSYTTCEDVALYLEIYERLPDNFITKQEARDLGWEGGSLEAYAPGKCIGGDKFGNYEGLLPEAEGRSYRECDIDTLGADSRGAKRIVYSNDGLIYYTEDHYASFTLLYN